jgi:hypothetical protein
MKHETVAMSSIGVLVRVVTFIGLLVLPACTKPNPESCLDGTCNDERFPFCDTDGSVAGEPGKCIAVTCTPGEFETCRGDDAIRCNDVGSDFDLVDCPLGCEEAARGCRQCTENTQCNGTTPICETDTSTCRRCELDDECPSRVCDVDAGACVAESAVIYASPTGEGALCSKVSPCRLPAAVSAASFPVNPIIRLLPGTYTTGIDIRFASSVRIVGTGASITLADTTPAFIVSNGANVEARGISLVSQKVVRCGEVGAPLSTMKLRDSTLTVLGNETSVLETTRCSLALAGANVSLGNSEIAISLLDDSSMFVDRVHMHGNTSHHVSAIGSRIRLLVTNSLFVDVGISIISEDAALPGSDFTMVEDTFVYTANYALQQGCNHPASPYLSVRWENAIIATLADFDAVRGPNNSCTFINTLLSRHSATPAGTFVADPQFVAPATRDFHLKMSSPAVDAATPSTFGLDSKVDLEGRARPYGAKPDLGAYEYSP